MPSIRLSQLSIDVFTQQLNAARLGQANIDVLTALSASTRVAQTSVDVLGSLLAGVRVGQVSIDVITFAYNPLYVPLLPSTNAFFSATLYIDQFVVPSRYDNTSDFYSPAVLLDQFVSQQTRFNGSPVFYTHKIDLARRRKRGVIIAGGS